MLFFKMSQHNPTSEILEEINSQKHVWDRYTDRQEKIRVQRETKYIPLIEIIPEPNKPLFDCTNVKKTRLFDLFPKTVQFMQSFLDLHQGEIGSAMVVLLQANQRVYDHIDRGFYYRQRDRFHFVIDGCYEYNVGDQQEVFNKGDLWWFDNNVVHSASAFEDRITLIFDVKDCKWRTNYNLQ